MNPVASLYNNRMQLHAAIEFACMDVAGKYLGIRACDLLGGAVREEVPFASYLFYRYCNPDTGLGGETTPDEIVAHTRDLVRALRVQVAQAEGRRLPARPRHRSYAGAGRGLSRETGSASTPTACGVSRKASALRRPSAISTTTISRIPTWGLEGMRRVRKAIDMPTATNTVVVNFEQLAACVRLEAVDVILLDTTFWGGLRQAYKAGQVLETFQLGAAVHSSGELGVQLATMLHLGAALPNLSFAADAHYHHLADDIIKGGKLQYRDGKIAVPKGPGLGVELDRDKVAHYAELYRELGSYPYDRDPGRPDWYTVMPERNYADPAAGADMPAALRAAAQQGPA